MKTLLLDTKLWDVVLDINGNIAVADNPYALAQDAASAIKLFRGELYYDQAPGVPYFESILGKYPNAQFIKAKFVEAALRVPGVVAARVYITALEKRQLRGQVHVTDNLGNVSIAEF